MGLPAAYATFHRLVRAWDESAVTWTKATAGANWTKPGGDYSPTPVGAPGLLSNNGTQGGWEEYDVTSAIQTFVEDPSQNHGLLLIITTGSRNYHKYHSSEYSDVSLRPKLTVQYEGGTSTAPIFAGVLSITRGEGAAKGASLFTCTGRRLLRSNLTPRGTPGVGGERAPAAYIATRGRAGTGRSAGQLLLVR